MKKMCIGVFVIILVITMVACSKSLNQQNSTTGNTTVSTKSSLAVGENAVTKPATATPTVSTTKAAQATTAPTDATRETVLPTESTAPTTQITTTESVVTKATATPATSNTKPPQMTTTPTRPATGATQATTAPAFATQTTAATKPATVTTPATPIATNPAPTATQSTNATAHSYTVTSDTATCTAAGKKTEICSLCGDKKVTNSSAKGHGSTRTETKEATTSAAGYTRVICNDCNGVVSETEIPKLLLPHTCSYKRINCKNLQDHALGLYTDKYRQYTNFTILACSECGAADTSSLEFIYTTKEATAMIVEMINQERYAVYGTHDYDAVVATHTSAAEWAAEYISTNFVHCTPFTENIAHRNPNGNVIQNLFDQWKNSPGHYSWMIDKEMKYISLGVHISDTTGVHGALVMWRSDELYLDNPNYTWDLR